jgi:FkbM family methyltransferase
MMIDFAAITRRSKLLGRICRIPLNMIPKGTVVPIMQGYLRGKRWVVGASLHSFWLGGYESDKQRVMAQQIKAGDIFYDIGANVGFYTLFGSLFVGETGYVYAFEPFPQNAYWVEKHVALNKLNNVAVFRLAIADFNGESQFQEGETDGVGKIDAGGNVKVEVAALDSLIAQGKLRPATIMKIDVEGAEYDVLKGAEHLLKTSRPRIFLATHGDAVHQQCVGYLTELGYRFQEFRSIDGGGEVYAY